MATFFSSFQTELRDLIIADAWLSEIPVVIEEDGDYDAELGRVLYEGGLSTNASGKVGIAMLIMIPEGTPGDDVDQVPVTDFTIQIGITENTVTNRNGTNGIGKTYLQVVERLAELLTNYRPHPGIPPMRWAGYQAVPDPNPDMNEVHCVVRFQQRRVIAVPVE